MVYYLQTEWFIIFSWLGLLLKTCDTRTHLEGIYYMPSSRLCFFVHRSSSTPPTQPMFRPIHPGLDLRVSLTTSISYNMPRSCFGIGT
ncbi:hypothetical protein LX36DRAFT_475162 [Colletotrichum falcatum]|nr:hypothetical protein LX36DRAFT_475162 [Colletotrichum falcatum]